MRSKVQALGFTGMTLLALSLVPKPTLAACPNFGECGINGTTYGPGFSVACTYTGCIGVKGTSNSSGAGSSGGAGVWGESDNSYGVLGTTSTTNSGLAGVYGVASTTTGQAAGVHGQSYSQNSAGVIGVSQPASGTSGYGVFGRSTGDGGSGVYGISTSTSGSGVYGTNTTGYWNSVGVQGVAYNGVIGSSSYVGGAGVSGGGLDTTSVNYGIFGYTASTSGYAGYFMGRTRVIGDFDVSGTLSKSAGTFKIDHPLDPANKYLSHSFVESSEVLNLYTGTAQLDAKGETWVTMPAWFDALNKDFRYQLTAIKAPGPNLHIAEELHRNRFKIGGGQPGSKVSWQVTGVRHDPYIEMNPVIVEQEKSAAERGKYIFPRGYGLPESKSLAAEHKARIVMPKQIQQRQPSL